MPSHIWSPCSRRNFSDSILLSVVMFVGSLSHAAEPAKVDGGIGKPKTPARELILRSENLSHPGGLYGATFTPDETKLLTHGADGCLKVWDCTTGNLLQTIKGLSATKRSGGSQIEWSAANDRIALIAEGVLLVFDYPGFKQLLRVQVGQARSARFVADDKLIVVEQQDQLEARDATTGAIKETILAPNVVHAAVYQSQLAYCYNNGNLTVRDFKTKSVQNLPKMNGGAMSLHFIDSGKRLVVCCGGERPLRKIAYMTPPGFPSWFVDVFDLERAEIVKPFGPDLNNAAKRGVIRAISPDDKMVVLGSLGRTEVYDAPDDRHLAELPVSSRWQYVFSKPGNLLAVVFPDLVEIWSTKTWTRAVDRKAHPTTPEAAAASPDGSFVATSTRDGVRLWNAQTGEHLWHADPLEISRLLPKSPNIAELSSGSWVGLKYMTFSADNRHLFGLEGRDGRHVLAFDVATGKVQRIVWQTPPIESGVAALRFTSDCSRMLVRGRDFYLVDTATGQTLWANGPRKPDDRSWQPQFRDALSPSGKLLARMSSEKTLTVLDLDRGVELFTCELDIKDAKQILGGVRDIRFVTSGLVAVYVGVPQDGKPSRLVIVEVASGQPCVEYDVPFGTKLTSARYGQPFWIAGGLHGRMFEFSLRDGKIVAQTGPNGDLIDQAVFVGNHGFLFARGSSAVIGPLPPIRATDPLALPLDQVALDACWKDLAADPRTAWNARTKLAKTGGDWPKSLVDRMGQNKPDDRRAVRLVMALGMSRNSAAKKALEQLADRPDESPATASAKELRRD
jgi:WD40 repeat protein